MRPTTGGLAAVWPRAAVNALQSAIASIWPGSLICDQSFHVIVIRHKETGETLLEVQADTLAGADLEGAMLLGADLRGADLRGAFLRMVDLCQADLRRRHAGWRRSA